MKTSNPVVLAFCEAFTAHETSGSRIADVCKAAHSMFKGKPVPEEAATEILDAVTAARKWEGNTAKVRRSECKRVLSVYSVLPEGIDFVRKRDGSCMWTDALRLATKIKANDGDLKKGIAAFDADSAGGKTSPKGRAAGALRSWYIADKKARPAIREAVALLRITGIDFDALDAKAKK